MAILEELEQAVRTVRDRAGPSVVGVSGRWARGSGLVVGPGQVLTNAHNVRDDTITITFGDGREVEGRPLGVDPDGDLAVLGADTGGAGPLPWAAQAPEPGAVVFALANPAGRGLRVTFGTVSGIQRSFRGPGGRPIAGALEHTAPLLPGSSGGPVVDAAGNLVGINTHRLGEGFYLAIGVDPALRTRVGALARGEAPTRRRLGIAVAPAPVARRLRRAVGLPEVEGVLVRFIHPDGPGARAGLQEGDLIVSAAGHPVASVADLHAALGALTPGAALELRVLRGTDERTVTVAPEESSP